MRDGTSPGPSDFGSWMRQMERDVRTLMSRPLPVTALDALGPGIDASATLISDWNDDDVAFNGMFYSEPGAQNAPDSDSRWVGLSLVDDVGSGYQRLWQTPSPTDDVSAWTHVVKQRVFNTPSASTRAYSPWA